MANDDYWNRDNFEGLVALATVLREDERFGELARYCELREAGLRKKAFEALAQFLEQTQVRGISDQREIVLRIVQARWRFPEVHQFLPDPLWRGLMVPVLEDWCAAEPSNPIPVRSLGLLNSDRELLDVALRLDPVDDEVRFGIVRKLTDAIDYSMHHLNESFFIGEEAEVAAEIEEASEILAGVVDRERIVGYVEELAADRALLEDWNEYRRSPSGTFPDWCVANGKDHGPWCPAFYYDE